MGKKEILAQDPQSITEASDQLMDLFAEEENEVCDLEPSEANCQRLLEFIDFFASPRVYQKLLTDYRDFLSSEQRADLIKQGYETFFHYIAIELELLERELEVTLENAQKVLKAFRQKESLKLMDLLLGDFKEFLTEADLVEVRQYQTEKQN